MPKYYFHIHDGHGVTPDDEGLELVDDNAAIREGETSARDLLKQVISADGIIDDRRIEVMDADGRAVATFRLRDLIN